MTLARHRSIRTITAFREGYLAEHPDATWNEAGIACVMSAGRRREIEAAARAEITPSEAESYAAFVEKTRASIGDGPPRGLKWPVTPTLIKATLGI
jgi:hypothetical protein